MSVSLAKTPTMPSLVSHILEVVLLGSKEEVVWSHAGGIVAFV